MIPVSAHFAAELRLLLDDATDSNVDSIRRELSQLVDCGLDGCTLVLQVCLNQVLLTAGEVKNLQLQHNLLSDAFRYCLDKTYFSTCFCEALRTVALTDGFLETLSNLLELSAAEKVGFGLALLDSQDSEIKLKGHRFSIAQIEELCSNPIKSLSNDQIHEIVMFLHQSAGLSKHIDTFNNVTSLLKVTERPFFAPVPNRGYDSQSTNPSRHLEMYLGSTDDDFESLLSEMGKEIGMSDIVTELGYGCTFDSTHCKEILSIFEPLDDVAISKLLGAVVGTYNGLGEAHNIYATFVSAICNSHTSDSPQLTKWNTAVLVDSINELVFKSLYDNASNSTYVTCFLATLVAIRDVCKLVVKELTNWVIYSDEEKKFNIEIIFGLIRSELLNLGEYNVHLAKLIDGGRNKVATEFAMSLVQTLITQDSVSISELYNVVDALSKLARRPGSPESLQQLIETARNNVNTTTGFVVGKDEKVKPSKDKKVLATQANKEESTANETTLVDPDQVAVLFSEWCQLCDHLSASDVAYSRFVTQLRQDGLLNGDDISERFFLTLTELAVTHSLVEQIVAPGVSSQQSPQQPQISYFSVDSYAKLVVMLLRYSSVEISPSKGNLLSKILSVTVRTIQKDAEEKKASFNPRPYFRLFINWFYDLTSSDAHHEFQVLTAFANAFHLLQPLRVPAWSFAWLELVSHRSFMPKLLVCNSQKGWPFFQRLLVDLVRFMEPYLRNAVLSDPVNLLYRGTMRVLLVLLHDFPEFLCDYHFSFCDFIPSSCIQMRNVILSAFPRNMRLPDPSTPNLKIDLLAEISIAPRIMSDVDGALKSKQLKTEVDEYLKRPEGSSFLSDLKQKLLLPQNEATVAGNVPLINSLVLYVGIQAVQQLQLNKANASASAQQINHTPPMDIFQIETATEMFRNLIASLDTEGRYLLLNAIANQLRYPNNHTHYFSFIILYLFAEATQDVIQEQITRVLLERLIVNRPHPWGLLITFIELIKNQRYNFWNRSFTHCAPEIEKMFESVARSCGGKGVDEGISVQDGSH